MTLAESPVLTIDDFQKGVPGIYPDIPFSDYLRLPLMSQSTLKEGRASMAHLRAALDAERIKEPTDAMLMGSALHVCFLEPEQLPDRVVLWAGTARRGKEWEAFQDEHAHQIILTKGFHEKLVGMSKALRRHPEVRKWANEIELVEVSGIGKIQGIQFKCRADALTTDPLWDLKKTTCCDDRHIASAIYTYGLHIQAYIYTKIFGRDRFCLGFVEDTEPYDVRVVELSESWMKIGKQDALSLIQGHKYCLKENRWPGRSDKIEVVEPPAWLLDQSGAADGITIGGEAAFME